MSLIKKSLRTVQKGFTIVELLIVITITGTLAAIVISSFAGAQDRALNAQRLSVVDAWTKAIKVYHAQTGVYPKVPTVYLYDNLCLGDTFPAKDGFAAGECYKVNGNTLGFVQNNDFNNLVKSMSKFSDIEFPLVKIDLGDGSSMALRGLLYIGSTTDAQLFYIMPKDVNCGRGSKTSGDFGDGNINTRCVIEFK